MSDSVRKLEENLGMKRDVLHLMKEELENGVPYWRELDIKKELPTLEMEIKDLEQKIIALGGEIE